MGVTVGVGVKVGGGLIISGTPKLPILIPSPRLRNWVKAKKKKRTIRPVKAWVILLLAPSTLPLSPAEVIQLIPPNIKKKMKAITPMTSPMLIRVGMIRLKNAVG